ncbi:hypothetical protein FH063_002941 [Azospirillum argentinense]|uniref:Uncharacterized protein n=1 Tax=Azospirillum argentinense TaxID=2970906 RepID=A0A5B0KPM1_9PROT|nr:hypothetical protein FH063_002941 [Azospirillum argentinense]
MSQRLDTFSVLNNALNAYDRRRCFCWKLRHLSTNCNKVHHQLFFV